MALQGGCLCGDIRYSYEGEPVGKVVCHCKDCQKISGSTYSTNALVPDGQFNVTQGTAKQYAKTADSGQTMTSFFCGNCGSTLWRETKTFEGAKIVKVGTLDGKDTLAGIKPVLELYTASRVPWVEAIPGTDQKATM